MNRKLSSTAVKNRRVEAKGSLDFFPTPPWATRALFERCFPKMDTAALDCHTTILDPCAGECHMAGVCAEYGQTAAWDIADYGSGTERHDFLSPDPEFMNRTFAWVIMNPPFAHALGFIKQALNHHATTGVAALVRGNFCETQGRYSDLFQHRPPQYEFQFVERVPMHKGQWVVNGKTATTYIWLVWLRHPPHALYRIGTQKFWIAPCRKELTRPSDVLRFNGAFQIPKSHKSMRLQEVA